MPLEAVRAFTATGVPAGEVDHLQRVGSRLHGSVEITAGNLNDMLETLMNPYWEP